MHTRAIVRGRHSHHWFWSRETDFGIEWQPDHELAKEHPKVKEMVEQFKKTYPIVKVEFRDC